MKEDSYMKKGMKKASVLLLAFMVMLCMITPVSAASKLNKSSVALCTGQSVQLKISGKAKWSSSNKSVATVTQKGKVSAKKKGTTTITAKVGKKKYTCKVTVEAPKLSKSKVSLAAGKSYTLKMSGTKRKVTWKSSKPSVASVKNGKVTAKKAGTAKITAKVLGKSFTCKVTVTKKGSTTSNTASRGQGVTYHAEGTSTGVVAILENRNSYTVDVHADCVFYLNGKMVRKVSDGNYAFEGKRKCVMDFYAGNIEWDSFKISLQPRKALSSIIGNVKNIRVTSNYGANNVMANVTNSGKKNEFTHLTTVYYQNGKIVGSDSTYVTVSTPGASKVVDFSLPHDKNYQVIPSDRYEIYVDYSYGYNR